MAVCRMIGEMLRGHDTQRFPRSMCTPGESSQKVAIGWAHARCAKARRPTAGHSSGRLPFWCRPVHLLMREAALDCGSPACVPVRGLLRGAVPDGEVVGAEGPLEERGPRAVPRVDVEVCRAGEDI